MSGYNSLLGRIKDFCIRHDCEDCIFQGTGICTEPPNGWNLHKINRILKKNGFVDK